MLTMLECESNFFLKMSTSSDHHPGREKERKKERKKFGEYSSLFWKIVSKFLEKKILWPIFAVFFLHYLILILFNLMCRITKILCISAIIILHLRNQTQKYIVLFKFLKIYF